MGVTDNLTIQGCKEAAEKYGKEIVVDMICVIVYGQMGGYHVTGGHLYEIYGIAVLLVISAFYKHKANIVRLMNGTENKLSVGKKS